MRVSIIGPAFPLRGGIAHHVYWLKKELSNRGHKVQVISFRKLYPTVLFPGKTVYDKSERKLEADALAVLDSMNPFSWLRAYRLIKTFAPDIVILQWWNPFFAPVTGILVRLLNRARLPCLMECHNVLPHERRVVDSGLIRFAFTPLNLFITHSQMDKNTLRTLASNASVWVAPLPTIEEFSSPSPPRKEGRTILFFGIVRKYKGLDVLLRAMPEVLRVIECNLIVIGEFYEPVETYHSLIRNLGIQDRVRIENRYIPNEEISICMNQADLLVLPYLSATQSGVARLAFLHGLPIIASNTGGLKEVVEDGQNGFLFEPGNAKSLAEKIIQYFQNDLGPQFTRYILTSRKEQSENIVDIIEKIAKRNSVDK